jgi:hypothetical protein
VTADAGSRGLTALVPLLQTLARSTESLRAADDEFRHPAATEHTEYTEHAEKEHDGGD